MAGISTLFISVLSGLCGALISAYLSYRIRMLVQKKDKRESETRLAYVYVVQLSFILAVDAWLRSFIGKLESQIDEPIPEGEFEFSHAVSVLIEDMIRNSETETFEKLQDIEKFSDQFIENLTRTYLSNDQQAELPKQTVIFYQRYEQNLKGVVSTIKLFSSYLSSNELKKLLDSAQIQSAIDSVQSLFRSAGILRAAMIEYGGIGKDEATFILESQYKAFENDVVKGFENKLKIEKAKDFLEKVGALNANK
ncbi:hypothetical protein RSO41_11295 [Halomonas sp. I1]|uniref:hypothetical protein n=1 Tax=Halomonas sp. I1 TaxID=393536 RepID=UPI0028DE25A8|nr:hypothetical protein [Halomonas sp. I1]MDT8895237.1 hypothetical protein [Halomonas sp. I1]